MSEEPAKIEVERTKKDRAVRTFPGAAFSESLEFAKRIVEIGGGATVRRLTLFDEIKKSPTSSASQSLLSNALKYGLTKGSYKSEFIELTSNGLVSTSEINSPKRAQIHIESAIHSVALFKGLYE